MDVPDEIRVTWAPRIERLLERIMDQHHKTFQEACEALELSFIASSEQKKIDAETAGAPQEERESIETGAQMFLQIVAELRAKHP